MRKLFYLLVLLTSSAQAQNINIPDANFKQILLSITSASQQAYGNGGYIKVDANSDGEIQLLEAQAVDSLTLDIFSVPEPHIANLTGISGFSNLKKLSCSGHTTLSNITGLSTLSSLKVLYISQGALTTLDVSMLSNLEDLRIMSFNNLVSLNVSGLANLSFFNCMYNDLTSLNLTGLSSLETLRCDGNQLTALNVSSCPNLVWLECSENQIQNLTIGALNDLVLISSYGNQLASLNLNGLPNLSFLDFGTNPISSIDLSALPSLAFLQCENTLLTTIDCSNNPLNQLYCYDNPQLETIFMKNGTDMSFFVESLIGCTNLHFVCIDESEAATVLDAVDNAGLSNVVVNTYCSFVPGGDYNTITGNVTYDSNNNGCDSEDALNQNIRVNINESNSTGASFTDLNGNYIFYTQQGSFEITPSVENPTFFTITPTTATIPFADNNNNTAIQNFCILPNGNHPDVEVVIAPLMQAQPGFLARYQLVFKNKGNQTLSGTVSFSYNDSALDFVSSTVAPSSQSPGTLNYIYTNLAPFQSRSYTLIFDVNAPTDTPPVNIDDQLIFNATINPVSGDETPSDNTFQYRETVIGSFDPNNITCIEGNIVPSSQIGNYLHYIINFENTGNADAQNIVVRNEINPNQFDVNSLQLLNSSAAVRAKLTGNLAEFIFPNINLHSGGHGNILLKIRSKNTLTEGASVSKTANIYFDYNFPVATDPEDTVFRALSNPDIPVDASISVYPNPTNGIVNIKCSNNIKSVQLYDVQGRILQTNLVNQNQTVLDITDQSNGVYFVKIISDYGMKVQKIVRE
ncbi:DUF7619 domain-containing protein [Flavobacterium sp.]